MILSELPEGSLKQKIQSVEAMMRLEDKRVPKILRSWLEGDLYVIQDAAKQVVFKEKMDDRLLLTDGISGASLGPPSERKIEKIGVNNKLRSLLRNSLARFDLNSDDASIRLAAVKELSQRMDMAMGRLFEQRLAVEGDDEIKSVITTALAFLNVNSGDRASRLVAIETLANNPGSEARMKLSALFEKKPDGSFVETDESVREAAKNALDSINFKLGFYELINTLYFGLSLGSVLALAAIGLAITFGVMGVINMAHGELMMLGAYTTYVVQLLMPNHLDWSLLAAVPAAFCVSALFGILIERGIIRFLYGRPLETLLATFGEGIA
ncbi:MAG: ABC transporter permease subunit [Methylococcales bacterium]